MIADHLDLDLAASPIAATKIQHSFTTGWAPPRNSDIFLGLHWAYMDCGYRHAAEEAEFLWILASFMDLMGYPA